MIIQVEGKMKKIIIILFLSIAFFQSISASQLNLQLQGGELTAGFFNSIRASAIDVDSPNNQPIIFRLRVNKVNNAEISNAFIHFSLHWNGNVIITNSVSEFREQSIDLLNNNVVLNLSNRDLIRSSGSQYLYAANPSLSLSDFLNNRHFKTSILNTGLFPDGVYTFTMQIKNADNIAISNESVFNMTVSNVYNISLIGPGSLLGSEIQEISGQPLNYLWNSNLINQNNPFTITIREYPNISSININNPESSGRLFHTATNLFSPLYNENLPYINGNYYAWNISMPIINDRTEFGINTFFSSSWYVFKYVTTTSETGNAFQNLSNLLNTIPHPIISQIISQGLQPTGNFSYNGATITYPQALNLLQQLIQSNIINIEIVN